MQFRQLFGRPKGHFIAYWCVTLLLRLESRFVGVLREFHRTKGQRLMLMNPSPQAVTGFVLLATGLSGCSGPTHATTSVPLTSPIIVRKDLSYGAGQHRSYDLYLPAAASPKPPLLVFVHGGAWITGDKRQFEPMGQRFAQLGVAVAVVNYTLSARAGNPPVPQPSKDLAQFLASVCRQDPAFDPDRVFLMGHSAGAHTIALLAARPELLTEAGLPKAQWPKGYIGVEGIYDLPKLVETFPAYRNEFVEQAFGLKAALTKGSPSLQPIGSKAPWILVHSTLDDLVDPLQSQEFADHLRSQGVVVSYTEGMLGRHEEVIEDMNVSQTAIDDTIRTFVMAPHLEP